MSAHIHIVSILTIRMPMIRGLIVSILWFFCWCWAESVGAWSGLCGRLYGRLWACLASSGLCGLWPSVVCRLCALSGSVGLWACLGLSGLAYGLWWACLWSGFVWALWACLVGFVRPDNVSAHFVFTCKKTRRYAPGVYARERLGQGV